MSVESVQPQSPDLPAFPLPYPISKVIGTIGYSCGQLWLLAAPKQWSPAKFCLRTSIMESAILFQ